MNQRSDSRSPGMEVCALASGSKGNSLYVRSGDTALLIDAGLSTRELGARLKQIGVVPESLDALMITHDHIDHYRAVEVFSRKYPVRLFANEGTASGIEVCCPKLAVEWEIFDTATKFTIGEFTIEPFSVSHDAADPVGFVIDNGRSRLGVVTDLGVVTNLVRHKLASCNLVVVESNHDYDMLMESPRPWSLKSRVSGRSGHLSNDDAARLVAQILHDQLHTILLAHISEDCNSPDIALGTVRRILHHSQRGDVQLEALSQSCVSRFYRV